MAELEENLAENYEGIISGTHFRVFFVQHHPWELVTWLFSLVKQLKHSWAFSIHLGLGIYLFSFLFSFLRQKLNFLIFTKFPTPSKPKCIQQFNRGWKLSEVKSLAMHTCHARISTRHIPASTSRMFVCALQLWKRTQSGEEVFVFSQSAQRSTQFSVRSKQHKASMRPSKKNEPGHYINLE